MNEDELSKAEPGYCSTVVWLCYVCTVLLSTCKGRLIKFTMMMMMVMMMMWLPVK